jgi:hypothetical protein
VRTQAHIDELQELVRECVEESYREAFGEVGPLRDGPVPVKVRPSGVVPQLFIDDAERHQAETFAACGLPPTDMQGSK